MLLYSLGVCSFSFTIFLTDIAGVTMFPERVLSGTLPAFLILGLQEFPDVVAGVMGKLKTGGGSRCATVRILRPP